MKTLALSALLMMSAPAFANDAAEAAYRLNLAKVTIADATATAQTQANGSVVSIELDRLFMQPFSFFRLSSSAPSSASLLKNF